MPYCRGGVMAKNPQWRGSLATWRARDRGLDQPLATRRICCRSISSSICAAVHGEASLADTLWRDSFRGRARSRPASQSCSPRRPARSNPRSASSARFKTDQGRIDLKKAGLFGIVTRGARARDPPSCASNVRRLRGSTASARSVSEASAISRHSAKRTRPSLISFCISRSTISNADSRRRIPWP